MVSFLGDLQTALRLRLVELPHVISDISKNPVFGTYLGDGIRPMLHKEVVVAEHSQVFVGVINNEIQMNLVELVKVR